MTLFTETLLMFLFLTLASNKIISENGKQKTYPKLKAVQDSVLLQESSQLSRLVATFTEIV